MAADSCSSAPSVIKDLLRLSFEEKTPLYLPALCLLLERMCRENGEEEAGEVLLTGLLAAVGGEPISASKRCAVKKLEWWNKEAGETWEYVWQLSKETPATPGWQTPASFVCESRHFQEVACQLAASALATGRVCGFWSRDLEDHFVRRFANRFLAMHIDRFSNSAVPNFDQQQDDAQYYLCNCLRRLSFLHTIKEISSELFALPLLKEECLHGEPLKQLVVQISHTVLRTLFAAYKKWWNNDEKSLKLHHMIPTSDKKGAGLILKSGHLLDSSLLALGLILRPWNGIETVRESCLQTILRLSNLHFKHIQQIVNLVPENMSVKLWYVIINSAICLHSMLTRLHSILTPPTEILFYSLIQEVTEFTDTLVSHAITYHVNLVRYSILQDSDSGSWFQSQPYHEGERCSLPIQMWYYYLSGLRDDLWDVGQGGGDVGGGGREIGGCVLIRILREVLCGSVSFLSSRYSRITPSYERTGLLRADILIVMTAIEKFLPCITDPYPPFSSSSSSSSSSSCSYLLAEYHSLLHTLTIVTSPLHTLSKSLETTPTLNAQPCLSNIPGYCCLATSNQNPDDVIRILNNFFSLPFPSWHLLIKLLALKNNRGFLGLLIAVATSGDQQQQQQQQQQDRENRDKEEEERKFGEFLRHLLNILSHCIHQPTLLHEALSILQERCKDTTYRTSLQMLCLTEWLRQGLKDVLQRCVCEWSAKFAIICWQSWDETPPTTDSHDDSLVAMVTDLVLKFLDALERSLGSLPSPFIYALLQLSQDGGNGKRIVEVVGEFMTGWVTLPSSSSSSSSLLLLTSSISSLLLSILTGTTTQFTSKSNIPTQISKALTQGLPIIEKRLQSFGSSLICLNSIPDENGMELGHEVMADILEQAPEAQVSLHYVHNWLQRRKEFLIETLWLPGDNQSKKIPREPSFRSVHLTPQLPGFNPFQSGLFIGHGRRFNNRYITDPELPWEDMMSYCLSQLSHDQLVKLVSNRFEFQPHPQLQDNEPQLVEKINNLLK